MESLFLFVLSMPAMESTDSIRLLYKHFLSKVTEKSLNAFYYDCSCAKIDCSKFMNVTFSIIAPESILMACAWQEKEPLNQTGKEQMKYLPLFAYSFRWDIEVGYYEQKTFWSPCSYRIRSKKGIETMVNLINISYCAMKILPYKDETFSKYKDTSVQELRFH